MTINVSSPKENENKQKVVNDPLGGSAPRSKMLRTVPRMYIFLVSE